MDLKTVCCPSCGGDLDISHGVDYIECPYCSTDVNIRDIAVHGLDIKI